MAKKTFVVAPWPHGDADERIADGKVTRFTVESLSFEDLLRVEGYALDRLRSGEYSKDNDDPLHVGGLKNVGATGSDEEKAAKYAAAFKGDGGAVELQEWSRGWRGADTLKAARENAAGTSKKVRKVAAEIEKLAESLTDSLPVLKSRKRRTVWSDEGSFLDTDEFREGEWDTCWGDRKRVRDLGQAQVEVVFPIGANANTSAAELKWSGVGIAAAVLVMARAGYSVGVRMANATRCNGCKCGTDGGHLILDIVRVFSCGEDIDAIKLATVLSVSVFRHNVFMLHGTHKCIGYGLGRAVAVADTWRRAQALGLAPEVSYVANQALSEDQARAQALDMMKATTHRDATNETHYADKENVGY